MRIVERPVLPAQIGTKGFKTGRTGEKRNEKKKKEKKRETEKVFVGFSAGAHDVTCDDDNRYDNVKEAITYIVRTTIEIYIFYHSILGRHTCTPLTHYKV